VASASRRDGPFFLIQLLPVAELVAGPVSDRTKAALAAAKTEGYQARQLNLAKASASGVASIRLMDEFAKQVLPVVQEEGGAQSLRAIARRSRPAG
jgi:hypothetical protein